MRDCQSDFIVTGFVLVLADLQDAHGASFPFRGANILFNDMEHFFFRHFRNDFI
jgi:hypothetical protein